MGTTVFTGMVLALQLKVGILHHQWTWPQVLVMAISIGGMFGYFLVVASADTEYYYVANVIFNTSLYWFFGAFSVPVFCILIDKVGFDFMNFFAPTNEVYFREIEHQVK